MNELTKQQEVLVELWKVFDEICRKHHLSYQLFAGTALGAIRHQSIIPWDDDLDVVMSRDDYEKWIQIAKEELNDSYFVQCEFSEHWPMFYTKLRKNNTAFMERQKPKDPLMHQGIYIDIFPYDSLSDSSVMRKIQFLASKVVIAKCLDRRGYLTDSLLKKVFIFICRTLPLKPFVKIVQLRKKTNYVHTFFGAGSAYEKNIYPRIWFEMSKNVSFCDFEAPVSVYYDELLTQLYGDYMIPQKEEDREEKVHAEIVDTERSYMDYLDVQKQMKYSKYTRSIR